MKGFNCNLLAYVVTCVLLFTAGESSAQTVNIEGSCRYYVSKSGENVNLEEFNFSVTSVSYANNMFLCEAQEISLSIENSGIAKIQTDCVIKLVLLNNNDKLIASYTTGWDAKSINGGSTVDFKDHVVFANAPEGIYKLAVGLFHHENDPKPRYNLDNAVRTDDDFYVIGTVNVAKADQTLYAADLFLTTADDNYDLSGHATSSAGANGSAMTYKITNAGTTGANIAGTILSYSSTGEVTITVTATDNINYNGATTTFMLTVVEPQYSVVVISDGSGATGDGDYFAGTMVSVFAGIPPKNQRFKIWTTTHEDIFFTDASSANTTFYMPASDVTVMATFEALTSATPKVYPNPFMDELYITGAIGHTLQIIDAKGTIVHIQKIINSDELIRLEHLPINVYFFRIEKNGIKHTIKVIKINQ